MAVKGHFVQRLGFVGLVLAVAGVLALILVAPPASAQFFGNNYGRPRSGMFNSFFGPFQGPRSGYNYGQPERPADYSHAPAPRKLETQPTAGSVLVVGDAMADWLAYGLEDALGDTPDYAVVRKNRTTSGLIHYDPRNETQDWVAIAREAIAATKPKFVVMMIGLNDRISIREKMESSGPAAQTGAARQTKPAPESKPAADSEAPSADAADTERPPAEQAPAPALQSSKTATTTTRYRLYDFHTDEWAELYTKRIDAMIAALKSSGVPVFWVGLPSIRGSKSTADVIYLNDLYRTRAEKAGITYVDVWDGFVDEAGRFTLHGPDFEGQTRRLRVSDGVYFTKAGARKLAHYVEREIRRMSLPGSEPIALPSSEPQVQAPAAAKPGGPLARPLSGPVVPLTASIAGARELVGPGAASEPVGPAPVTRVLVKGDAVSPPAGRSDDFQWPRRSVAPFGADPIVATTTEPLPVMKSPQETTVAAPSTEARPVTAAAPTQRRTTTNTAATTGPGRAPYQPQPRGGFSFFSFFR